MNYRRYADMSKLIKKNISVLQEKKIDLIVGISKHGMIPAYMIALYLNKNCCTHEALINNQDLKTGITRKTKDTLTYPMEAKHILLVKDFSCSTTSANQLLQQITETMMDTKTTVVSIYSGEKTRDDIDIFFEYIPRPQVFEWTIFDDNHTNNSCFDIDGVLCTDPSLDQDDDGEKYKDFLINAPPLIKPMGKINYLVTSRLEKYRAETEIWLKKNDIEYGSLIMLNLPTLEERRRLDINAIHKAEAYKDSGENLFYESSRKEAIKIHELTKKPVYCVDTNEMFSSGSEKRVLT